jgi:hypothetical protein
VRELARELVAYGERHEDLRTRVPKIKADLEWALDGKRDYVRPPAQPEGDGPKRGKKKKRRRED